MVRAAVDVRMLEDAKQALKKRQGCRNGERLATLLGILAFLFLAVHIVNAQPEAKGRAVVEEEMTRSEFVL